MKLLVTAVVAICSLYSAVTAAEHDYYRNLRYPPKLDPGVGRDTVDQEGPGRAVAAAAKAVAWPTIGPNR